MMSVKPKHLLLLLQKISIPIYVYLPELQDLKNSSAVEVRSSSSQSSRTASWTSCQSHSGNHSGVLPRARTSGSLMGPNPDCRVDWRAVPSRSSKLSARSGVQCEASRCHVEG
jgi:hypothetical protein